MAAPPASAIRGPLPEPISKAINNNDLVAASVLSGNRNFEGRVSPDVRANYLASPPLVVAYALKGTVIEDMVERPIGTASDGDDVYLKDIWPTNDEIRRLIDHLCQRRHVPRPLCRRLQGRRALAEDRGDRRRHLWLAGRIDLHRQPALFRGHDDDAGGADRHHRRAPARHPRRSASPPTTSARPARSSWTARPAST